MSESSPYASEPLPPAISPAAPVYEPGDTTQAFIRGAVAILLAAAGILCQLFGGGVLGGSGFPSNAPVEMAMNFGITVVLIGGGIALMVTAVAASRPRILRPRSRVNILAFVGAGLVALALFAFLTTLGSWLSVLGGERGRFDGLIGGLFLAGIPWITGIVLATISLRTPGTLGRVIAGVAIVVGLVLTVPAIAAAALYSAGITD